MNATPQSALNLPTALQLFALRWLCARTHGAHIDRTTILRVAPGYGRAAGFESSDAVVTVAYRQAGCTCRGQIEHRGNDVHHKRFCPSNYTGSLSPVWHADYAFLRGRWVLWAD